MMWKHTLELIRAKYIKFLFTNAAKLSFFLLHVYNRLDYSDINPFLHPSISYLSGP